MVWLPPHTDLLRVKTEMSNNNEKPLISIIVPVYNTSAYLTRCVESLTSQTYKNIEIILVDDGSTDNSGKMCDELAAKDSRIRVIHKQNGGVCTARNAGLDAATGSLIGFVDSDDYVDKDMYSILQEGMKGDISAGNTCNVYEDGSKKTHNITDVSKMPFEELLANFTRHGVWQVIYNKLYSRKLIGDMRFRHYTRAEDANFMFRLIRKRPVCSVCSKAMYYYCMRSSSAVHERKLYHYEDSYLAWREIYSIVRRIGKKIKYWGFFALPFTNFAIFASAAGNEHHSDELAETSILIRKTRFWSSRHLSLPKKLFAAAFVLFPTFTVSIMRMPYINEKIKRILKVKKETSQKHGFSENKKTRSKEKTVGIMTFHRADNYGALLQAYALKRTLRNLDVHPYVINYKCPAIESTYSFFSQMENFGIKWILRKAVKLICLPAIILIRRKFNKFRNEYLHNTDDYSPQNINHADFDIYISGSDQVFNPQITGFDSNYFLDFVKDKRKCFSYAASFGLEYSELGRKEIDFFHKMLHNFAKISVREKEGISIIEKTRPGKECFQSLDPVLLLNSREWEEITVLPKKKGYVLMYLMNYDDKIINYARELAKAKKLRLILISHKLDLKRRPGIKKITPTPQEFLGYFINADYVITNSFHGTAISTMFNKAFFTDMSESRKTNPRLMNFLELTGLTGRLIDNIGTDYDAAPDWQTANAALAREKAKSLDYLKEIVK